jgi:hypothetical protein
MTNASATVTEPGRLASVTESWPRRKRMRTASKVYIGLSVLIAGIALTGFWSRYFGPLVEGAINKPSLIHFHAAIFSGWVALFAAQIVLVAIGRTGQHRRLGKLGIYYGFTLIAVGLFTGFVQVGARIAAGDAAGGSRFLLTILSDMAVFSIFFGAAVAYRHKPDIHKRCMLVATTGLLVAAILRMDFIGGPFARQIQLLIWISPILLAFAYDFYARRIVHPVYVVGAIGLLILSQRAVVARTEAWQSIAGSLTSWIPSSGIGSTLGRFPL